MNNSIVKLYGFLIFLSTVTLKNYNITSILLFDYIM